MKGKNQEKKKSPESSEISLNGISKVGIVVDSDQNSNNYTMTVFQVDKFVKKGGTVYAIIDGKSKMESKKVTKVKLKMEGIL